MSTNNPDQAAMFTRLLQQATIEPGTISKAYSAFYGYSLGNTLLAWALPATRNRTGTDRDVQSMEGCGPACQARRTCARTDRPSHP
jgi:hypothetical protein